MGDTQKSCHGSSQVRPDTYYSRTLKNAKDYPALEEAIETDVCVIGGGLAGLAVALGLAERGKSVVLLESRQIGHGASGRNGGFALSGFALEEGPVIKKVGLPHARALFRLTQDALRLIKKRIRDFNIDCDAVDGNLTVSWYDDETESRARVENLKRNFDENVEFWPREKVRDVCRTSRYYDGRLYPDDFHMHPLNYMHGIARAVEQKGGKIFEFSAATAIEEKASGHIIRTEKGSVRAAHIVFCGSAYFNGIEKKLSRSCLPVSTYVMVTEPVEKEKRESAIRVPYAIRDNRWADDYYRILPDGRILWGGGIGLGHTPPKGFAQQMLRNIRTVYPQLEEAVRPYLSWAGTMGYTAHKMPNIGQMRPGIWACTNFGGNGVCPTTAGGEVIARAIAKGDETYKLYEPWSYAWTGGVAGQLAARAVYFSWGVRDAVKGLYA